MKSKPKYNPQVLKRMREDPILQVVMPVSFLTKHGIGILFMLNLLIQFFDEGEMTPWWDLLGEITVWYIVMRIVSQTYLNKYYPDRKS